VKDSTRDLTGRMIGRIKVESTLGQGGMGVVYLGWDQVLNRHVAIKTIKVDSPRHQQRLLQEARILSKLEHPNICRIYDIVSDDPDQFLIMEYVSGVTLRDQIKGATTFDRQLELAQQVAAALDAAHQKSVIHRDLKPENIMVDDQGMVKVLDFGIARSIEQAGRESSERGDPLAELKSGLETLMTQPGALKGTLRYMSPEQAKGHRVTPASDMYSFGIILQEIFSRTPAYAQDTPASLYFAVASGKTQTAKCARQDIATLIQDLKHLDPERRPNSRELVRRLDQIASRTSRIRRVIASVALVVLFLSLFYVSLRNRSERLPMLPEQAQIALLPIENATGDPSLGWVDTGLGEILAQTLDEIPNISAIPMDLTIQTLKLLEFDPNEDLSSRAIGQFNASLGADAAIKIRIERRDGRFVSSTRIYQGQNTIEVRPARSKDMIQLIRLIANEVASKVDPEIDVVPVAKRYDLEAHTLQTYAMGINAEAAKGPATAIPYFQVCVDRDSQFSSAHLHLAKCYTDLSQWDQALAQIESGLEIARREGDRLMETHAIKQLGFLKTRKGEYDQAAEFLEQAAVNYRQHGRNFSLASCLNDLGTLEYHRSDIESARGYYKEAAEICNATGHRALHAAVLNNLGLLDYQASRYEQAAENWRRSLKVLREVGHKAWESLPLGNLGMVARVRGDIDGAIGFYQQALDIAKDQNDEHTQALHLYNIGEAQHWEGRLEPAIDSLHQAIDLAVKTQAPDIATFAEADLLLALSSRDQEPDQDQVSRLVDRLKAAIEQSQSPRAVASAMYALATYHVRRDEMDAAQDYAHQLAGSGRTAELLILQAELAYARDEPEQALRLAKQAEAMPGQRSVTHRRAIRRFRGQAQR